MKKIEMIGNKYGKLTVLVAKHSGAGGNCEVK